MKDFWVRVTSVSGQPAEAIQKLLDTTGVIMCRDRSVQGLKILDVYTDKDQFKSVR
jgi:hypothetical protein